MHAGDKVASHTLARTSGTTAPPFRRSRCNATREAELFNIAEAEGDVMGEQDCVADDRLREAEALVGRGPSGVLHPATIT